MSDSSTSSPRPDALGRSHQLAYVDNLPSTSSPGSSPRPTGSPKFPESTTTTTAGRFPDRLARRSSLTPDPNSLVSRHISTFSPAPSDSPQSRQPSTTSQRNFTSPLPLRTSPSSSSSPSIQTPDSVEQSHTDPVIPAVDHATALLNRSKTVAAPSPQSSPSNARFDHYKPRETPKRLAKSSINNSPMNRSPSSMNLPRELSRRLPSPLPTATSTSIESISALTTPSPSMSLFGPNPQTESTEPPNVPDLIAAAGSAEAAIQKLLLEKQTASSHNSQLWRLVEKQRSMVLGLNKDLERALKDKEKYRKKLKDHLVASASMATITDTDSRMNSLSEADDNESTERSDSLADVRSARRSPLVESASTSLPMYSTPMRAPFGDTAVKLPATAVEPKLASTRDADKPSVISPIVNDDALPSDYSIFREQRALANRKGPPTPLNLSQQSKPLPPVSLSNYAPEASLYLPTGSRGSADRQIDPSYIDRLFTAQSLESTSHTESPQIQAEQISRGSSPTSPDDVGSPHIAQVQTYGSVNAVNAVMLNSQGNVQQRLGKSSVLPALHTQLTTELTIDDLSSSSPYPHPLSIPTKSTSVSPNISLFPRSPHSGSQYSPSPTQPTTASSPLLSTPSLIAAEPRPASRTDRIASAPNVGRHAASDTLGLSRSHDGVYRDFVSDDYPGNLLPPGALSSVRVTVDSARLRPSRSHTTHRTVEDTAVLTLAVCSRIDNRQLWRIEKPITALASLDQQLKSYGIKLLTKLPDRNMYSGHAPARIDTRRAVLASYFDQLLDLNLEGAAASILSVFLSTNAISENSGSSRSVHSSSGANAEPPPSRPMLRRDGYLTKKGKNFGGWKARYFVFEGSVLDYYESPSGAHLGTIRLQNARIGRQTKQNEANGDDVDDQYRHAFMVLEPKRQDSSQHLRHILCAENDEERDAWVFTLQYGELKHGDDKEIASIEPVSAFVAPSQVSERETEKGPLRSAPLISPDAVLRKAPRPQKSANDLHRLPTAHRDAITSKANNSLRAVGYTDVVAAEAPIIGPSSANTVEPFGGMSTSPSLKDTDADSIPSSHPSISGPSNAAIIHETSAWGSKQPSNLLTKEQKEPRDRDKGSERKRSIFAFRGRSIVDSSPVTPPERLRAVFGAPLTEACELARPKDVNVYLPAVLYRCIQFLHAKGALSEEGIFRISGSSLAIKSLRERFDSEGDVTLLAADEQSHDIHTVASLLKLYFRELPANILTREMQGDFFKAQELEGDLSIQALNVLVNRLPRANREVLSQLTAFLREIVDNESVNKMSVRNVGIVFAPTLNIPAPLISLFVTDQAVIFGPPLHLDLTFMTAPTPSSGLSIFPGVSSETHSSSARSKSSGPPTPNYKINSFPNLTGGSGTSAGSMYEQQTKAAKEAFDTGYRANSATGSSTATLASARQALGTAQSQSQSQAQPSMRAPLDRSNTDSPLASHRHRMSIHNNDNDLLNVSISQSPLLGAQHIDLRREKSAAELGSQQTKASNRKSGQFVMNVGLIDAQGLNKSSTGAAASAAAAANNVGAQDGQSGLLGGAGQTKRLVTSKSYSGWTSIRP